MQRQKDEAAKIKEEDDALNHRLARESRFTRLAQNLSATAEIVKIQEEANLYLRKIETEREKIVELDNEIADTQSKIIEQRRTMGGHNASKNNHDLISRQVRLFENRLDKALIKFNESLSRNKTLRENIDNLRRERVVFDGVYKKLERDLHDKKQEMAAIIEDSKNAYQARDRAASQLASLKELSEREQADFAREWEKFGKAMEEELRMRETLGRVAPGAGHSPKRSQLPSRAPPGDGSAGTNTTGETGAPNERSQENVSSFEESVNRLKESTGIDNLEGIVQKFLDTEDKNFRLFNFVNGLNSEVERYELMIAETKKETEAFKGHGLSSDAQKRKVLTELSEKLSRTEAKAIEHEYKWKEANDTISELKSSIQSMYSRLGSNRSSGGAGGEEGMDEFLGSQGVTETSMLQYLGIIEQKTSELLHLYCETREGGDVDLMAPRDDDDEDDSGGIKVHGEARIVKVVPPSWDDISDSGDSEDDDNERPLTREEVHRRTIKSREGTPKSPKANLFA